MRSWASLLLVCRLGRGSPPRPERPQAARPARRRAEGPPARAGGALESVEKVLTGAPSVLIEPVRLVAALRTTFLVHEISG